jgi:hypothetical protein
MEIFAQNTLTGYVYDESNGESLIGANVFIKQLEIGASTNVSGYFVISKIPNGRYELSVSYVGYNPKNIEISLPADEGLLKVYLSQASLETDEVVVKAESDNKIENLFAKNVSTVEMTPTEVNQIPRFIEADLLRALQTLPGVSSVSDFSSALNIRGGTADQNLYLVDGTDVYNPEHAFGIFSTFNTAAIKKVELYKGGFSPEYGGRLSSVLNVINLDGNRKKYEGDINISLIAGAATFQGPIGGIGSISGSFRRTYIDQTLSKIEDDIPDYYFYDGNLKAYLEPTSKDQVSISFFNSKDNLDFKNKKTSNGVQFFYNWRNITGSLNWKHIFGSKLFSSFWVTGSEFRSDFDFNKFQQYEDNGVDDVTLKGALEYYGSNSFTLKLGGEQKFLREKYEFSSKTGKIFNNKKNTLSALYVSSLLKPTDGLELELGVRTNFYSSDTTISNFSPRFSAKYRLSESSNLKFSTGIFHQYLNRIPRFFMTAIWMAADKYNPESKAYHYILGYQKSFGREFEVELETYYKQYENISMYNPWYGLEVETNDYDENGFPLYNSTNHLFLTGKGESFGAELLLKKNMGAVTGWLSAEYARTNLKYPTLNRGNYFIPRHDRTVTINGVFNVDWDNIWNELSGKSYVKHKNRWLFSLNFVYSTGQPISVPASSYYLNTMPDWNGISRELESDPGYKLMPANFNSYRLPAYIRVDASITREFNFNGWSLSTYLQIYNLTNRKNVWYIDYLQEDVDGKTTQKIDTIGMLPIIPSLGVQIKF